jgi:hypothetical protein
MSLSTLDKGSLSGGGDGGGTRGLEGHDWRGAARHREAVTHGLNSRRYYGSGRRRRRGSDDGSTALSIVTLVFTRRLEEGGVKMQQIPGGFESKEMVTRDTVEADV